MLFWLVFVCRFWFEIKDDGKLLSVCFKVIIVGIYVDLCVVEDRDEMLICIEESLIENDDF